MTSILNWACMAIFAGAIVFMATDLHAKDMSQRRYTVSEIDYLRQIEENKVRFNSYYGPRFSGLSPAYEADVEAKIVEERVRTDMIAGFIGNDLLKSEAPPSSEGKHK